MSFLVLNITHELLEVLVDELLPIKSVEKFFSGASWWE
jgi:hypothetical protein